MQIKKYPFHFHSFVSWTCDQLSVVTMDKFKTNMNKDKEQGLETSTKTRILSFLFQIYFKSNIEFKNK